MLRHQISEIIRETAIVSLHNDRVSKRSSLECADQIIQLIRDEMELRAEVSRLHGLVEMASAHLSLPG